jgi:hypothetical protein
MGPLIALQTIAMQDAAMRRATSSVDRRRPLFAEFAAIDMHSSAVIIDDAKPAEKATLRVCAW